jgi:hypothetical protein
LDGKVREEERPASLSVVQSRKILMRAHIVSLVLDAEKVLTFILICRASIQQAVKFLLAYFLVCE